MDHSRMLKHNPSSVLIRNKLLEEVVNNKIAAKKGKCTELTLPNGVAAPRLCLSRLCSINLSCSHPPQPGASERPPSWYAHLPRLLPRRRRVAHYTFEANLACSPL